MKQTFMFQKGLRCKKFFTRDVDALIILLGA